VEDSSEGTVESMSGVDGINAAQGFDRSLMVAVFASEFDSIRQDSVF
jgi:hypothetical protein